MPLVRPSHATAKTAGFSMADLHNGPRMMAGVLAKRRVISNGKNSVRTKVGHSPTVLYHASFLSPLVDNNNMMHGTISKYAALFDKFLLYQIYRLDAFQTPHLLFRSFSTISKEAIKMVQSSDIERVCVSRSIRTSLPTRIIGLGSDH